MPESNDDLIKKLKIDYENLFSSDIGQRVLRDLMASCGMFRSSFDKDPYATAFNEGKRMVGLHLEYMVTPQKETVEDNKM